MIEPRPESLPEKANLKQRLVSVLVSNVVVAELVWLATLTHLSSMDYSWGFFVLVPLVIGTMSTLILGWKQDRPTSEIWKLSGISSLAALIVAMVFAGEGAICACMTAPIYFVLLVFGSWIGHRLLRMRWGVQDRPRLMASVLLVAPLAMIAGGTGQAAFDFRRVETTMTIDAPPEKIWPLLQNLPNIPSPRFWMFKAGVAHPVEVRTEGGRRFCVLSTGAMPERITEYEPNRTLEFEVLETPPTMVEINPIRKSSPAHLTGYFQCLRGRFVLTPLPGGRTRLTGTSWTRCRFGPNWYWGLWTDTIVHQVHVEVMNEIARRAGRPIEN